MRAIVTTILEQDFSLHTRMLVCARVCAYMRSYGKSTSTAFTKAKKKHIYVCVRMLACNLFNSLANVCVKCRNL